MCHQTKLREFTMVLNERFFSALSIGFLLVSCGSSNVDSSSKINRSQAAATDSRMEEINFRISGLSEQKYLGLQNLLQEEEILPTEAAIEDVSKNIKVVCQTKDNVEAIYLSEAPDDFLNTDIKTSLTLDHDTDTEKAQDDDPCIGYIIVNDIQIFSSEEKKILDGSLDGLKFKLDIASANKLENLTISADWGDLSPLDEAPDGLALYSQECSQCHEPEVIDDPKIGAIETLDGLVAVFSDAGHNGFILGDNIDQVELEHIFNAYKPSDSTE